MKRGKLLLLCALLLVAVAALTVPSQAAATTCLTHPGGGYACVDYNHLSTCDTQVDGNRVRTWFHLTYDRGNYYIGGWAPSGGCTDETYWSPIYDFRVCIENEGCTGWKTQY